MSKPQVINVESKLGQFNDHWNPRIIGELNGQQVKVAKLLGVFDMHKHEYEDELFYVIKGTLHILLKDEKLELNPGEFVIIPKGTLHQPIAYSEVEILLFEPASTLNTGNIISSHTKQDLEKI